MAPRNDEHCENCLKHLRKKHGDGPQCGECLPVSGSLRRCDSCRHVRYCTRECQKAHWKQHKQFCCINARIQLIREVMGGRVAERQKTFAKWCEKHSQYITCAALSALEIVRDRERTESHVFLIYLDVVEHSISRTAGGSRTPIVRSIRDARCVPMSQIHQMFGSRFPEGQVTLERNLAMRPGLMRILIVDDGLPMPLDLYTLPCDVGEDLSGQPFDPGWLARLKRSVDYR